MCSQSPLSARQYQNNTVSNRHIRRLIARSEQRFVISLYIHVGLLCALTVL